ncbi:hypothetical protein [Kitasatospora sp. NPDC057015]|uniref:hypothetical protein n=1 Tax=Kitasatospora sp. NPDC057015 TaxID=3346001 RepID=UPI00363FE394
MGQESEDRAAHVRTRAVGTVGHLLAGLGAATAALVWAPRAAPSLRGGFEGEGRDLSVLFVDLPLIVLGGVLLPLLTWTLTLRLSRRPWIAALAALAVLGLGAWGLSEWWNPRLRTNPGYGPGI